MIYYQQNIWSYDGGESKFIRSESGNQIIAKDDLKKNDFVCETV